MPFIGQQPLLGTYRLLDSITTSATTTFALTVDGVAYTPASAQNLIVSLNGVTQAPQTAYTIEDSNIVFATALTTSDVIDYIMALGDVLDVGTISDGTVTNAKLQNGAVTTSKMTIDGSLVPTANVTYDLGSSTSRFKDLYLSGNTINLGAHTIAANTTHVTLNNIAVVNASVSNDLTVSGDLIVNGNTTTISATTLNVDDPLIKLAAGNETSDTVDIGFLGHYSPDGGNTALHTGFFRDATDGQYYLFTGLEDAALDANTGPNTIDRTANTFTHANLNIGGLTITSETDIDTGIKIRQFVANNVADGYYYLFSDASRDADLRLYDFTNSTDILYFEKASTHVGIGTNNPQAKLDIRQEKTGGGVLLQIYNEDNSDTTTQVAGIALGPDTRGGTARITAVKENASFATNAGRDVALTFSSLLNNGVTERMRIASNGNVGIGNTSPNYILDVDVGAPASSDQVLGRFSSQNGVRDIGFVWDDSTSTLGIATLTNHALTFHTNGNSNEHMRIASNGNVGIGETNPTVKLQINNSGATVQTFYADVGNYNNTQTLFEHTGSNTPVPFRLTKSGYTGNSQEYGILHLHMNHSSVGGGSNMYFTLLDDASNITEYGGLGAVIEDSTNGSEDGGLAFYTTSNSNTRQERMRIDSTGDVGIGTTGPARSLQVHKTGTGGSNHCYIVASRASTSTGQVAFAWQTGAENDFSQQWVQYLPSGSYTMTWYHQTNGNVMTLDTSGNLAIVGTFTESSALRYKENIQDLEYNNIISQLKPKVYNKIGQEKQEVGLIAEEVEALDKTLVTYNDDGQVEGIQYTRLVPHLIAHIQKLEERLSAIENG